MVKLVIFSLFVCGAVLATTSALKCKMCKNNDPKCATLEDQTCPAAPSNMEAACVTFIYKSTPASKEEMIEKKCVNRPKGGKYDCIPNPNTVQVKCDTCTEDYCNSSAARVQLGVVGVLGVVVAIFANRAL